MEIPTLKAGKNSTEFIGKVVLQFVIIINLGLRFFNLPSMDISPEGSVIIAGSIETVWIMFRQWNKRLELSSRTAVIVANGAKDIEKMRSDSKHTEMQSKHYHDMEKLKISGVPESMKDIMDQLKKGLETANEELKSVSKE